MSKKDKLSEYHGKRDMRKTPEPSGGKRKGKKPVFVIQKHDARNLHYDFRLEADGVLKSWAVPRGPSTDPREKRLAVPTEDHPLDYVDFEGVIPEGEYGGGTVMVWDTGTYRRKDGGDEPLTEEDVDSGHVEIWLEGKKLRGGYALIRTRGDGRWLLIKMKDKAADACRNPVSTEPDSAISGRSLEEISEEEG